MAAPSATAGNMAANLILGEFFDKTTWQPQLAAWWTAQQAAGTAAPAPSATAGNMAANLNGQSASSSTPTRPGDIRVDFSQVTPATAKPSLSVDVSAAMHASALMRITLLEKRVKLLTTAAPAIEDFVASLLYMAEDPASALNWEMDGRSFTIKDSAYAQVRNPLSRTNTNTNTNTTNTPPHQNPPAR